MLELERNRVRFDSVPDWKESAAGWGWRWAAKVLGRKNWLPLVRWYSGPPTEQIAGCSYKHDPDVIWLSIKLASCGEIVTVSAHEATHAIGDGAYDSETVPCVIGMLACKHWSGEATVYTHWGDLGYGWLPPGLKEVPGNSLVLEFNDAELNTYRNHGTATRPSWRRVNII